MLLLLLRVTPMHAGYGQGDPGPHPQRVRCGRGPAAREARAVDVHVAGL